MTWKNSASLSPEEILNSLDASSEIFKNYKFKGTIYGYREGELYFANEGSP